MSAHERIDQWTMRGFGGLIVVGLAPIVADLASGFVGAIMAVGGVALVSLAWVRIGEIGRGER